MNTIRSDGFNGFTRQSTIFSSISRWLFISKASGNIALTLSFFKSGFGARRSQLKYKHNQNDHQETLRNLRMYMGHPWMPRCAQARTTGNPPMPYWQLAK